MMKYTPDFSSRFRILKGGKISLVVSALIAGSTMSFASPTGGQVTSGSATINQSGSVTTINQSTNKASINWNSFSIAPSETVNFVQPSSQSVTLNRVIGATPSLIQGALNANGQVFLLNPNGVLFANGSQINVGGLVASTLNITDANFQAGNYLFEGNSQNSIINMGTITTAQGGYVAMMGKTVANEGTIVATMGNVQLAGGDKISLNLNGNSLVKLTIDEGTLNALVENKGLIQADGGQVFLTTQALNTILDGMVNNTGIIEAKTLGDVTGNITLFAHGGTTNVSGTLDATGGFIETSGHNLGVTNGTVIKAKTWLLDPTDVTIDGSNGAVGGATVGYSVIEAALGSGDVTITADNDINVNHDLSWSANSLTLTAGHDINVNASMTLTDAAGLALNYDAMSGAITMGMNSDKTDFIGKINLATGTNLSINTDTYTIINGVDDLWTNLMDSSTYDLSGHYALGSDFSIGIEGGWTPIGDYFGNNDYFGGNFNGLGHTLSDLYINNPSTEHQGLFGYIAGGNVSNVRLTNVNITVKKLNSDDDYGRYVGGIAGTLEDGTITNSIVSGVVEGDIYVGGIVGEMIHYGTGALLDRVHSSAEIKGRVNLGGLAGYMEGEVTISNSSATGAITLPDCSSGVSCGYIGGLVGEMSYGALLSSSHYVNDSEGGIGSDTRIYEIGGLVGSAEDSYIEDSYASVKVKGVQRVGGLVGNADASSIYRSYATGDVVGATNDPETYDIKYIGGLVGYAQGGTEIQYSYATGNVDGGLVIDGETIPVPSTYVGGLVGSLEDGGTIYSSYATGSVSNGFYIGGLVGNVTNGSTISNTYATGNVSTAGAQVGGLVGYLENSTIEDSYYAGMIDVTAGSNRGGLVGGGDTDDEGGVYNSFYDNTKNPDTALENTFSIGKSTADLQALSTFDSNGGAGWDILGDENMAAGYPQLTMDEEANNVWKIYGTNQGGDDQGGGDQGGGDQGGDDQGGDDQGGDDQGGGDPTPTPTPTTTTNTVNNVVTTIVNSTTVTPPAPIVMAPLAPQPQQVQTQAQNTALVQNIMTQQGDTAGGSYSLLSTTDGVTPTQTLTLDQLQKSATAQGGVGEIRVPLGQDSVVELINGGVNLPQGVSQEFYIVASNTTGTTTTNSTTGNSSNNKKTKKN